MIELIAVFCLKLNPYMCYEMRLVPDDYRAIVSIGECMMGGAIGSTTFIVDHQEYFVKGWRCISQPPKETDIADWVTAEQDRLRRTAPQIK